MSTPPITIAMLAILFIFIIIFENRPQVFIIKLLTKFFFFLVDINTFTLIFFSYIFIEHQLSSLHEGFNKIFIEYGQFLEVGFAASFDVFFRLVTNLTYTRFLTFSIVFQETELFIILKKAFFY